MTDKNNESFNITTKLIAWLIIIAGLILLWIAFNCWTTIQPGKVGLVKLFGKLESGYLEPGLHLVNPLVSIKEMTTKFNQVTVKSPILTEDNLNIMVETTIFYKLAKGKYKYIYANFGDDVSAVEHKIISPALHSSIREACATMDWDTLSTHRDQLKNIIRTNLELILKKKGFTIENVMINDIQPPQKIKDAVMNKLQAQQEVTQMKYEQQKAVKEAQIKVIDARGIAKAQEIIQRRLTPLYVQYYAIQSYKLLTKNKNATFIVMPTNPKGSGLPMILNANK